MNKTNANRIKVLGILSLPLLAVAAAVMVFAWGHSGATSTEAVSPGPDGEMILTVKSSSGFVNCVDQKCTVGVGDTFVLSADATALPAAGIGAFGVFIDYGTNLTYKKAAACQDEVVWSGLLPASICLRGQTGPGLVNYGVAEALTPPFTGTTTAENLVEVEMNCTTTPTNTLVQLIPFGVAPAGPDGTVYVEPDGTTSHVPKVQDVEINCEEPPTFTPTNTATNTPTNTPTATPAPKPRMQKCVPGTGVGQGGTSCENLTNAWLVRQGDKIPPLTCLTGDVPKGGVLDEVIDQVITSPDPKGLSEFQLLGAFEFELNFDETKICIELSAGPEFEAEGTCLIEDAITKNTLEGVARIGCFTVKKGHDIDPLAPLAVINIRPQPDVYSTVKPNQDNGQTVQINNVGCDLSDEQGHAIGVFSCEDADITFRYLEGDVEPDCVIDALDAQAIAFRWGAQKGSTFYREFMNLEPSGTQADNDIDINDLQFVFGRFNSTCQAPHPPQDPVNPKA